MNRPSPTASSLFTATSVARSLATAGLCLATFGFVSAVDAGQVTYELSGTVDDMDDPSDVTGGATDFSLLATYDTEAPNEENGDPQVSTYRLTDLSLRVGSFTKSLFADPTWFVFAAEAGHEGDSLYLHAQDGLLLQLTDLDDSVLSDQALPSPLPAASEFEHRELSFSSFDGEWFEFDGTVTAINVQPTPSACPADTNADGFVDATDLFDVITSYGPCADCTQDIDASGSVEFADLMSVIVAWGTCGS